MAEDIKGFQNDYRWLSNFVWCAVEYDGMKYPSVEHAYQAAKTLDIRRRILMSMAASSGEVKRMGSSPSLVKRADWEDVRESIMLELLIQKFTNERFMNQLLSTDEAYIEETNAWGDTFWGVCNGVGENRLGLMIMAIRDIIREDVEALLNGR